MTAVTSEAMSSQKGAETRMVGHCAAMTGSEQPQVLQYRFSRKIGPIIIHVLSPEVMYLDLQLATSPPPLNPLRLKLQENIREGYTSRKGGFQISRKFR